MTYDQRTGNPTVLSLFSTGPGLSGTTGEATTMNLGLEKKVGYSPFERKVFDALMLNAAKTTVAIADEVYSRNDRPHNARQTVLGALVSLAKKTKANREPFKIRRTKRNGPHPIEFWIER